jgi:tetratricopeptide (TPR) repeat protein
MSISPSTDVSNYLAAAQQLIQKGELAKALETLDSLPKEAQATTSTRYMRGVCYRHMKNFGSAEALFRQILEDEPSHSRAFQELGHLYRDADMPVEALNSYATACHLNPALKASWLGQKKLLSAMSQPERLTQVQQRLDWLEALPPNLVASWDLLHEGRLHKAEQLCRQFMQQHPRHIDGMRILAEIAVRHGVLEDAEFLLESAVTFEPNHRQARIDYVQILSKRQRFQRAVEEAKILLDQAADSLQLQSLFAIQSMQLGDYETALDFFEKILEEVPHDPVTHVSRGHALKTGGKMDDAVASYRAALKAQPHYCDAWYSLANLKVYRFDDEELAEMQALDKNPHLAGQDKVYLQFALGKAFEDRKDYAQSFHHYARGNAVKKAQLRYRAEGSTRESEDQIAACTRQIFDRETGHTAPDPIFILGLPRAGSTLLEQILSSHSMVDGTLELPNVLSISGKLRRLGQREGNQKYPFNLADLSAEQLATLGEEYIRDTQVHRMGAPFFIDKMPNNFRHIGLIKLMLPNAKVIDARRDPMSCCFSGFKQLFAEGQMFSYDQEDIAQYYLDYVRLMNHWDEVIPDYVLRVQHEDVVADLETQVRRMLDFCGLPFEESCLEFHKTERNVRTPSSEQVRQPIFSTALEQWKHYEPWLGPLKARLGPDWVAQD